MVRAVHLSRLTGKVPTSHETLRRIARRIDDSMTRRPEPPEEQPCTTPCTIPDESAPAT